VLLRGKIAGVGPLARKGREFSRREIAVKLMSDPAFLNKLESLVRSSATWAVCDREDIAQQIKLKIIEQIHDGRVELFREVTEETWKFLALVIRNACIDVFRKERPHLRIVTEIDEAPSEPPNTECLARMERLADFTVAAEVLTPDERRLILCYFVYDFTLTKTGQELGMSKSAVARKLEQIRAKLKRDEAEAGKIDD
jgi:RNA polymerase sigma factor (sigma-70 family)